MKSKIVFLFVIPLIFIQNSCKLTDKRAQNPTATSDNAIFSYFLIEQYAIESEPIQKLMSGFFAQPFVAQKDSTFDRWSQPEETCMYTVQDHSGISPIRGVDIGKLKIDGDNLEAPIEVTKAPESSSFSSALLLDPGHYQVQSSGVQEVLKINQEFFVPDSAEVIAIQSGDAEMQVLPSPEIPNSSDPNHLLRIYKSKDLVVAWEAPEKINYVRIIISDNSSQPEGSITCYARPDRGGVVIPAGALSYFRSTDDGRLYVDFVSTSVLTEVSKITESLVQSYVRHLHGAVDFMDEDQKRTAHFGILRFE